MDEELMFRMELIGSFSIIESLLDAGISVDSKDGEGMTALCAAAQVGMLRATQLLMNLGAHVNLPSRVTIYYYDVHVFIYI